MLDNLLLKKFFLLGFFISLIFGVSPVLASNPITFLSATSNILDPGATNTPWGGCGPTAANCYVAKKIVLPIVPPPADPSKTNTTGIVLKPSLPQKVVTPPITNQMLVTAL